MKEDCETIFDYLTKVVGLRSQDIILWGRSMGTGVVTYLATKKHCHNLFLMSPYMSILDAAKDILGWASFISFLVNDKFRNIDII